MLIDLLLPDPSNLKFEDWCCEDETLIVGVSTVKQEVHCPYCGTISRRVHSYHDRKPMDLPWSRFAVLLRFSSSRFGVNAAS